LVGIITETDILGAFVDLMGIRSRQTRLELILEAREGAFLDVCRIIQEQKGDIAGVFSATATHEGAEKRVMLFRLEGVVADPLVRALEANGHTVLSATP
jgi:acetoin utilization protein AcuB